MDNGKVGAMLKRLRLEKGLTQQQVADALLVSDRAVSKWERGLGCPDVSLLPEICCFFGVPMEGLLSGDLNASDEVKGNMKKIGFYVCPVCGNILSATGDADISCCGRKLTRLVPQKAEGSHQLTVETVEDEYFLKSDHEMTKAHQLAFIAFVTGDRMQLIKLYPEWNVETRLPARGHGILYFYCNQHGFFRQLL